MGFVSCNVVVMMRMMLDLEARIRTADFADSANEEEVMSDSITPCLSATSV